MLYTEGGDGSLQQFDDAEFVNAFRDLFEEVPRSAVPLLDFLDRRPPA